MKKLLIIEAIIIVIVALFVVTIYNQSYPKHTVFNTVIENHDYIIDITIEKSNCKSIRISHNSNCMNPFCIESDQRNEWADNVLNPK